jgi:hypothetical protein
MRWEMSPKLCLKCLKRGIQFEIVRIDSHNNKIDPRGMVFVSFDLIQPAQVKDWWRAVDEPLCSVELS